MLVNMTSKCNEGCPHCLVGAKPNGMDSTLEQIDKVCYYLTLVKPQVVVVSGGEITLSSNWYAKCKKIADTATTWNGGIIFESNGSWFWDGRYDAVANDMKALLNMDNVLNLQLSSNSKYYPNHAKYLSHVEEMKSFHPKVAVTMDWQGKDTHIIRLGRAKKLVSPDKVSGKPSCAPLATMLAQFKALCNKDLTWSIFNNFLIYTGYFCKPMVHAISGSVFFGETYYCMPVDNINRYDINSEIANKELHTWFMDFIDHRKQAIICNGCNGCRNIDGHTKFCLSQVDIVTMPFDEERTINNFELAMAGRYITKPTEL